MNKKSEYTNKKLLDALLTVMREKPLTEITVTELCRAAGINRTTFYRRFSVPQDVFSEDLREHTAQIMKIITDTLDESDFENDIYLKMLNICRSTSARYGAFFEILRSGHNSPALMQPLFDFMLRQKFASYAELSVTTATKRPARS